MSIQDYMSLHPVYLQSRRWGKPFLPGHCISIASERVSYREIFIFSDPRRVKKLERRLAEAKSGYSCRYYPKDSNIPRLQFVIIDNEEALFFASSAHSPLCAVKSREFCKVFHSYFEAAWSGATPIKDGPNIDEKQLVMIQSLFSGKAPHK